MVSNIFFRLCFLFFLLIQANLSHAADGSFCSLFSLPPELSIKSELDDCKIKLNDTKNEISNITTTTLDGVTNNTLYAGDSELISCEKELIDKIQELEDLRNIPRTNETEISAIDSTIN